jgi:hypothetical protein
MLCCPLRNRLWLNFGSKKKNISWVDEIAGFKISGFLIKEILCNTLFTWLLYTSGRYFNHIQADNLINKVV